MKVLETVELKLEWSDADPLRLYEHPLTNTPRSTDKLHLSEILKDIAVRLGKLDIEDRDDEMPLRVFLGLAWEAMAVRLYDPMYTTWQPGEFESDDIAGTPDGLTVVLIEPDHLLVEEFKYTGKSMRVRGGVATKYKDIRTEWLWIHQVMGYINILNRSGKKSYYPPIDQARLHICWSCGAYTYPLTPRYIRYLVKFEESELKANWDMITKHAKTMDIVRGVK